MTKSPRWCAAALACLVLSLGLGTVPASAESMDAGKAFTKLTGGAVNIFTGWVEIPKRIQETSEVQGAASGWTWGLLRGLGYGFVRTAAGFYELLTFPVPAPADYAPVMEPPYIFSPEEPQPSSRGY